MKLWWCVECQARVGLGKHGRCEICESEAVDLLPDEDDVNRSDSMAAMDMDEVTVCV
jgi:hypothetical protein